MKTWARIPAANTRSSVGGKDNHDKGTECLRKVGKIDLGNAADHQEADEDQRGSGSGVGDDHKQGTEEGGDKKEQAGDNRGQTGAPSGLDAGGGFDKGGDGGIAGAGTDHRADRVDKEGLFDAGQVAVFIQHLRLARHTENGAEGEKKSPKKATKISTMLPPVRIFLKSKLKQILPTVEKLGTSKTRSGRTVTPNGMPSRVMATMP